jgi:hypothetical protein
MGEEVGLFGDGTLAHGAGTPSDQDANLQWIKCAKVAHFLNSRKT